MNHDNPFSTYPLGSEIGVSSWLTIDQPMIDQFGTVTLDPDPMHIDPVWAGRHSPYRGTIAFGFLTISLLTHLLHDAMSHGTDRHAGHYLNYGFDRLRLISPVLVSSRIRGRFTLAGRSTDDKARYLSKIGVEVQIEGGEKPALIADWLAMWVPSRQEPA